MCSAMQKSLILQEFEDCKKTVHLLKESVKKFKPYNTDKIYSPDELEYYDSLSYRFEKSVELMLAFFKGFELFLFSKISDTLRSRLLVIQKLNIIDSLDFWMDARLLRNKIAHTYLPEEIKDIYSEIYDKSKEIFRTTDRVENYLKQNN